MRVSAWIASKSLWSRTPGWPVASVVISSVSSLSTRGTPRNRRTSPLLGPQPQLQTKVRSQDLLQQTIRGILSDEHACDLHSLFTSPPRSIYLPVVYSTTSRSFVSYRKNLIPYVLDGFYIDSGITFSLSYFHSNHIHGVYLYYYLFIVYVIINNSLWIFPENVFYGDKRQSCWCKCKCIDASSLKITWQILEMIGQDNRLDLRLGDGVYKWIFRCRVVGPTTMRLANAGSCRLTTEIRWELCFVNFKRVVS